MVALVAQPGESAELTRRTTCKSFLSIVVFCLVASSMSGCFDDSRRPNDVAPDLPGPGANPPPNPPSNSPPSIAGQPATSGRLQQLYDFTPRASDPDGDSLRFEIQGRPAWATFSPTTGRLYGTPTSSGTFGGITISVTDGTARAALPAFSITVTEAAATGYAKLSWTAPTTNTDGSPLTDLAGFRIYYGLLPDAPSKRLEIADPSIRSALIQGLSSGTWYFSISAYTYGGAESARTRPMSKTI